MAPRETCESCDYETPAAEMTLWRSPIVTRVFAPPPARASVREDEDAWLEGPFLYRRETQTRRICVWCAQRMGQGGRFGDVAHNRVKLGLVVWLALALTGIAAFPAMRPILTSAFWQEPEETGRRPAPRYVVGGGSFAPDANRSSRTTAP